MSVHIGLLIWKEMKKQDISQAALAEILKIRRGKISTIINSPAIKTDLLFQLSTILKHNFFVYFQPLETTEENKNNPTPVLNNETDNMNEVIREKNLMLDLAQKTILSQKRLIERLEKSLK